MSKLNFNFTDFKNSLNEADNTAQLQQQKVTLIKQINDLQRKLLDVNQQIIVNQKATLAQNPQAQIPVQESVNDAEPLNNDHKSPQFSEDEQDQIKVNHSSSVPEYELEDYGFNQLNDTFVIVYAKPGDEENRDVAVNDLQFQSAVEKWAKSNYSHADLGHYMESDDSDFHGEEGHSNKGKKVFNTIQFWKDLDVQDKDEIVHQFISDNVLIK